MKGLLPFSILERRQKSRQIVRVSNDGGGVVLWRASPITKLHQQEASVAITVIYYRSVSAPCIPLCLKHLTCRLSSLPPAQPFRSKPSPYRRRLESVASLSTKLRPNSLFSENKSAEDVGWTNGKNIRLVQKVRRFGPEVPITMMFAEKTLNHPLKE